MMNVSLLQVLAEMTNGGVDRSVECTGNINAMISAFECVHDVLLLPRELAFQKSNIRLCLRRLSSYRVGELLYLSGCLTKMLNSRHTL